MPTSIIVYEGHDMIMIDRAQAKQLHSTFKKHTRASYYLLHSDSTSGIGVNLFATFYDTDGTPCIVIDITDYGTW